MIRDRCESERVPGWGSRSVVCFVRVSWRRALLDGGLGPQGVFSPAGFLSPNPPYQP